jgi:hypothetical protein
MAAANEIALDDPKWAEYAAMASGRKQPKYHNEPFVDADGVRWDSQAEFRRWGELQLLERVGLISDLERQVTYTLVSGRPSGRRGRALRALTMRLDFEYTEAGRHIVEDTKGMTTRDWANKAKMFCERYPTIELRVNGERWEG